MSSSRAAGVLFLWFSALAGAAEPILTHLYPVAGTQGTTASVAAAGKYDPWPLQVWVDAPGIIFRPSKTKGKFDVEIARDAAPGPHLVRMFNDQGASAPRFFIVTSEPELPEVEPNNDFKSPQKITALPATINGRLDKPGDVDSFAGDLKKGQALTASVEAYVLASSFDGLLRIVDTNGTILAFNHDGRTLDPLLTWTAPRDGTFILQLMGFVYPATAGVELTGGDNCVYRLHLSTNSAAPANATDPVVTPEQEPNDVATSAQTLAIPGTVSGAIEKAGDEDRFAFTAVKQKAYTFTVVAEREGSKLDAWLKIENKEGKQLVRIDDTGESRDPQLTWTAPSDGVFIAALGDVTHHGGAGYTYRLVIDEAKPSVAGIATGHSVTVTGGKTGEIKATVKRANGFKTKLQLVAKALPEGVTAPDVDVPDKDGEVILKIVAEATAPAANQPFQLFLRETESKMEYPVPYFMTTTAEDNGVKQGYSDLVIDSTDQLWLTVIAAAPPKPESPKPETPPAAPAR